MNPKKLIFDNKTFVLAGDTDFAEIDLGDGRFLDIRFENDDLVLVSLHEKSWLPDPATLESLPDS